MALSTFTLWYNPTTIPSPELSHSPKLKPDPISPFLQPPQHHPTSCLCGCNDSRYFVWVDHTVSVLLYPAHFIHHVFRSWHPCYSVSQDSVPFCGWMVIHCIHTTFRVSIHLSLDTQSASTFAGSSLRTGTQEARLSHQLRVTTRDYQIFFKEKNQSFLLRK